MGMKRWPKLSETLPYERHPDVCQACGARPSLGTELQLWSECNDHDQPTPVWVNLCTPCANCIVGPHPRLYDKCGKNYPAPGAMPHLCADCTFREGLACRHPDLKANGGSGLMIKVQALVPAHILYSGAGGKRRGAWISVWKQPAEACAGRKTA